jgi:regulator of sigma E protease
MKLHIQYSPLAALPVAIDETYDFARFNLLLFGKLFTGKLSLQSLGGPITIFDSAGDSLNYGFLPFIGFLAFLSISIGVINLFPIPGLDGGHLFLQLIEAITRRAIPDNIISLLYRIGFIFIIFILIQALINDILRLF